MSYEQKLIAKMERTTKRAMNLWLSMHIARERWNKTRTRLVKIGKWDAYCAERGWHSAVTFDDLGA